MKVTTSAKSTELIKPKRLQSGQTLGVFTPSSPSYKDGEELFVNGVKNLEKCGFKVKLGTLTERRASEGYRSASPQARAQEFMELVLDPAVHGLISTIGGNNSSSMIPWLDFAAIRQSRKPICGYSDVTSLHAAILKFSGLRTFYGPAVMCWFGDWPDGIQESTQWFLEAVSGHQTGPRSVHAPAQWSNHMRNWQNGDWQTKTREWKKNEGWKILNAGEAKGEILAFNLNTILCAAGTGYWPDFSGKILLLEDMDAPHSRTERALQQLSLIGVFDEIKGLIFSKPEVYNPQGAAFGYDELIREMVGKRPYPIVTNFDCGHTVPMITIPQLSPVALLAHPKKPVEFTFLDGAIS